MRFSFLAFKSDRIERFLEQQKQLDFSYPELKGTQKETVPGYNIDDNSIYLGTGLQVWQQAKKALDNWQQFPFGWTTIYSNTTPLKTGNNVAVLFNVFGIWWINGARIVYDFDEPNRYGFAYGTLTSHIEIGEECFWITRNEKGAVYYHIKAFSKHGPWYVKLTYPIGRYFQKKFAQASLQQMKTIANKSS